ncbi:MAG: zf-HC2 domain-containing protein [Planctomycetes bacterium]|nr:zf-HC2 domain-containing protein [Planctomycetota bacterium]
MDKPMDCAGVREVIPLYVDEACEPTVADAVRAHLAGCVECSEAAKKAVALRGLLQRQPPLHAPDALWAAISDRVAASPSQHGRPAARANLFRALWKPKILALAAATLLGVGLGYSVGQPRESAATVTPRPLQVVDVPSPEGLEVAFLLAEHGRTGDAPAFSTHPAVFTGNNPSDH